MAKKQDEVQLSDFNLQSISTEEYSSILQGSIQSGTNLCVFGRRGSGKTEIAKNVIKSVEVPGKGKAKEVYINLSVVERTDIGGYPDMFGLMNDNEKTDKKNRFVSYVLPKFFEAMVEGDQPIVALFDEVDKADPSVHAPLLEILQFRSINGIPLKNLHCTVATGNLISEGSSRPSLPLLDRAEKYIIKADTNSFLNWASRSNRIHPSVRQLLNDKPNLLMGSNDGAGDLYAEASPRTWDLASQVISFGEANNWDRELIFSKVSGFVGKKAGLEYRIYYEHYRELLPIVDKIFQNKEVGKEFKRLDPGKQTYAALIVCARLAGILDANKGNKKLPDEVDYVGKFIENHLEDETVIVSVRTQLTLDRILDFKLDSHKIWKPILHNATNNVSLSK